MSDGRTPPSGTSTALVEVYAILMTAAKRAREQAQPAPEAPR